MHPEATYEEYRAKIFADLDGKLAIATASPRLFESAALGNVMLLHEGRYGGVILPDVHYIPIKEDYSNVHEVVDKMRDTAFCRHLAKSARRDLIESGDFTYPAFVRWFDRMLAANGRPSRRTGTGSRFAFYAKNYCFRAQGIIPRRNSFVRLIHPADAWSWLAAGLPGRGAMASLLECLSRLPQLFPILVGAIWRGRSRVDARALARDLVHLAALLRAGEEPSGSCPALALELLSDVPGRLLVRSRSAAGGPARLSPLDRRGRECFMSASPRMLVWEHVEAQVIVHHPLGLHSAATQLDLSRPYQFTTLERILDDAPSGWVRLLAGLKSPLVRPARTDPPASDQASSGRGGPY
jgi:hypothetical protein